MKKLNLLKFQENLINEQLQILEKHLFFKNGVLYYYSDFSLLDFLKVINFRVEKAKKFLGYRFSKNFLDSPLTNEKLIKIVKALNLTKKLVLSKRKFSLNHFIWKIIQTYEEIKFKESEGEIILRPPVISIMGHVNHGKTTLINYLLHNYKKQKFLIREIGDITQNIYVYETNIILDKHTAQKLTLIDTPGHEIFEFAREFVTKVVDFVILVIAINEGVKQQTVEIIKKLKEEKLDLIIFLNKLDLIKKEEEEYKYNNVINQLADHDLLVEELGGNIPIIAGSLAKKINLKVLEEVMTFFSGNKQLKTNPRGLTYGIVLDVCYKKKYGIVVCLLVKDGLLKKNDLLLTESEFLVVKTLKNSKWEDAKEITASQAFYLTDFSKAPKIGDFFCVLLDKHLGENIFNKYLKLSSTVRLINFENHEQTNRNPINEVETTTEVVNFTNLIIKTNSENISETIKKWFSLLKRKNEETKVVNLKIVKIDVGNITKNDLYLAKTSNSRIITFQLKTTKDILKFAHNLNVSVINYDILHLFFQQMTFLLNQAQAKETQNDYLQCGKALVRGLFKHSKYKLVIGCLLLEGDIKLNDFATIFSDEKPLFEMKKVISLRQENKDLSKVKGKNIHFGCVIDGIKEFVKEIKLESKVSFFKKL